LEVSAEGVTTVVLRATRDEAAGASLRVAGLRVVDRAVAELGRRRDLRVVIVSDGAVALPSPLPANVSVQATGEAPAGATVVGADIVRPRPGRLDDPENAVRVVDQITRRQAEDAVFATLLRGDLGFVARHINKKISFRITRGLLVHLPVTPNQVTVAAGLIGLVGALLVAHGSYLSVVAGFVLAQLQSILDGCDGELARVRFQQSASGEWLDTIVDDGLNLAFMLAVGLGLWRQHGGSGPGLALGLGGAAMLLTYNTIAYRELIRQGEGGEVLKIRWWFASGADMKTRTAERKRSLFDLLFGLGRRDFFIFAWLIFALFNRLSLVLVYALIIAASCFVVAIGQIVTRRTAEPLAPRGSAQ
jgi:hypothetical protein